MVPLRGVAASTDPAQSGRAIVKLAKRIGNDPADRHGSFAAITETAAALLQVERVGIWLYDAARTCIECADLFERDRGHHSSGLTLEAARHPTYFGSLKQERILAADDAQSDPRTEEFSEGYLVPHGIGAMLDAPIRVGGRMVGVICHEAVGEPRAWTTEEQALAASMGDFVSLAIESSERERAQHNHAEMAERLARARKMEALGRLAGSVAHDFNNLLTAIQGSVDLIRYAQEHDRLDAALLHDELGQMTHAADRAGRLIKQLLGFSRHGTVNARRMNAGAALADMRELLARLLGESIRSDLRIHDDAPDVNFDPEAFEHLIMNLAANARDAMPHGGELQIVVKPTVTDHVGDWLELQVTDTGKGIPPEVLPLIFDPFFSTKLIGTGWGLGLATVQRVVESAGGYIFVRSEPGNGTVFRIRLPAVTGG